MARLQLGKALSDEQVIGIVSFLESLTETMPAAFVTAPRLPVANVAGVARAGNERTGDR